MKYALPLAFLIALLSPAMADDDHDLAREIMERGEARPLQEILEDAAQRYESELIGVDLIESAGGWVYDIKVLDDDGRMLVLRYAVATGKLLDVKGRTPSLFEDLNEGGED